MPLSKNTQKWIAIAQEDLRDAEALLEFKERFLKFVVFSSQQASEKIIKAYLTHNRKRFPKTHDLEDLIKILSTIDSKIAEVLFETPRLSQYSVAFRYPDAANEELTVHLGNNAVQIAKKTVMIILENLNETLD